MGKPFLTISLSSLCIVLLASACFAISSERFNECQNSLNALEPDHRVEADGGLIETWNSQYRELRCVGVTVCRRTLYRNALHLASYSPYPQMILVVQGEGVLGLEIPGCPETYEEPSEQSRSRERQQPQDRHQKIRHFKQGDVLLIPPGVPYWTYNTGDENLVAVSLLDTTNDHNQLDQNPRVFYLAGKPGLEHPETMKQEAEHRGSGGRKQGRHEQQKEDQDEGGSVLSGFSKHFLAQAFNTDEDTAEKLQSHNDERKQLVIVKGGLSVISPKWQEQDEDEDDDEDEDEDQHQPHRPRQPRSEDEDEDEDDEDEDEERDQPWPNHDRKQVKRTRGRGNGIEENVCSLKLQENIVRASRANFYNPRAGRIMNLNSDTLPALRLFHLSAQYVVLYKNGIYAPHWNLNANSIIYVTRGEGRVRVVNSQGISVFNGKLKRGQLLVVPQNFVVAEQAGEQGFEYIVFKTNHNAITSYVKDVFRAIPSDVLANSYNLRQSQAHDLKKNGNWGPLVNPNHSHQRHHLSTVV